MPDTSPHLDDDEWTRRWVHDLDDADRARIHRAVMAGETLRSTEDARVAAELARRLRGELRPNRVLVAGLAVAIVAMVVTAAVVAQRIGTFVGVVTVVPLILGGGYYWLQIRRNTRALPLVAQAERANAARVAGG